MRRSIFSVMVALLVVLGSGARAQGPALSFEQLTIGTSAVGLAAATKFPSASRQVRRCEGVLEVADVRYRVDGTNPTSTVGSLIHAGDTVNIEGPDNVNRFKAIRDSMAGADAKLPLHCY